MKKFLVESFKLSLFMGAAAYCMLSVGFTSQHTTINESLLFDACFNYVTSRAEERGAFSEFQLSDYIEQEALLSETNLPDIILNDIDLNNDSENSSLNFSTSADSLENSRSDSLNTFNTQDPDTLQLISDTDSSKVDTVKKVYAPVDSTARIKYFKYSRNDVPYTLFQPKKQSKFFARPSASFASRSVELDSTGEIVLIKEKIAGKDSKIVLQVPLEEYVKLRLDANNRKMWEDIGYKYELKKDDKDLSTLITDITNIDIPLPSAGFLSIFGPPKINIKIGGAVDIHGAWRNETSEGVTASLLGNTRNEPDFKQQVQINVNGTIGDKLKIGADWNTERTFEYENQLKLNYTGYEDEIIQSIEAGNVSLQTSPLVGGSEALFGVKANFQMGPFSLTALASQKKGEVKEVSVSGGSSSNNFEIEAWNYSKNHYFLHEVYSDTSADLNIYNKYYGPSNPQIISNYIVERIEVWKSVRTVVPDGSKEREINAFIDLGPRKYGEKLYDGPGVRGQLPNPIPGQEETGRFVLLSEDIDYTLNKYTGVISFKTQIQEEDVIAVAFTVQGPTTDPFGNNTYGEFYDEFPDTASTSKLVLKLVKPQGLIPQYEKAWKLQLKNIYPLGARSIQQEGFKLDITYKTEGSEASNEYNGINLLSAFGLDKYDKSGAPGRDGEFDFRPGQTIIPETGEIIFPYLQPFGRNLPAVLDASIRYNEVYDTTQQGAKNEMTKNKFRIAGKYSGTASSTFSIGFNVVENSVKVLLGGRQLTPGADYVVDYNIGQVTIRNDAALAPGSDLKITFEQNDLFQLASKTLVGLRGKLDIAEKTNLGFSFLNLNQETLSEKVRIGEEPLSNSIMGLDFGTEIDLPFLTDGVNKLISTRAMSSLKFTGEFAYISPDPNTKRSTIQSDNDRSIAFVDDFEGAKRTIPVGVSYSTWKDLSRPYSPDSATALLTSRKAKSFWYNILSPSDAKVIDIWGESKKVAQGEEDITVLNYVFRPGQRGVYNNKPSELFTDSLEQNWGGIMKLLSTTATNLEEENIEFVEYWFNVVSDLPPNAEMYIDLGRLSEDVIEDGELNTEDFKAKNGLVDEGEDVGLDGKPDEEEEGFSPGNPDPAGDNYYMNPPRDYYNANGTEGNAAQLNGNFIDTEDLNRNGSLDRVNSFFRYRVPLDTNRATNPFIVGGGAGEQRWFQVRVPIRDKQIAEAIGNPTFSNVESIRFWFKGFNSDSVHIRFAEINLVGNQWQKVYPRGINGQPNKDDSVMVISVINKEDNPFEYYTPTGVISEVERTTKGDVERNEQSLNLIIRDLDDGAERQAIKFLYRPLDLFSYKEMKLFVHGDDNKGPNSVSSLIPGDTLNYNSEVYFRFGADTVNFYEYRMPVESGWHEVSIIFEQLTALKQLINTADTSFKKTVYKSPVSGKPGHYFGVRGKPALTSVNFFSVGVLNPKNKGTTGKVSGEIWVNELRVIGADNTKGWAYSSTASLKIADVMTVNFNMSQTDPYFHRLSDRFGSRNDTRNWSGSVDLDVMKLLPVNLPGSNLRINYSRNEQMSKPLYEPGTDVKVETAAQERMRQAISKVGEEQAKKAADDYITSTRTMNVSETWSMSGMRIKVPSNYWLVKETINNLTFGFNFNRINGRTPTTVKANSWVWNADVDYNLSFSQKNFFYLSDIPIFGSIFKLFKDYKSLRIFYSPQTFSAGLAATRNYSYQLTRTRSDVVTTTAIKPNLARDFKTTRNAGFTWNLTDGGLFNLTVVYNSNVLGSLSHLLTRNEIGRRDREIWGDIFDGEFFGRPYQYQQNFELRTNPRLPSLWNLNKFFTITTGYSSTYNWQNNFEQEELGRGASFSNRISAGVNIRLKSLFEPMFKEESETSKQSTTNNNQPSGRSRGRGSRSEAPAPGNNENGEGETTVAESDSSGSNAVEFTSDSTAAGKPKFSVDRILNLAKGVLHWTLIDYETIKFGFSQDNQVQKTGIKGTGTGFSNFWGISQNYNNGPTRLFMLGLSSDVGEHVKIPRTNLTDNLSQRNTLDFSTSRPLWTGAQIELKWKVGWGFSKSSSITLDTLTGDFKILNSSSTGNVERSFVSLPNVFFLPFLKSGIKKVSELYDPASKNLSSAFVEGFETFPFLAKLPILKDVSKYVPRPNWSINWDGLEKFGVFKSFTKRVGLSHAYSSSYSEGWKIETDGRQVTQFQKISYGFQPLLGVNLTFNSLWNGNLSGSIKYSTKTGYDLGLQTNNITESFSKDIGITANYSKSGLEIPIFGIYLKNDIEASFSYTSSINNSIIFDMTKFDEKGTPQEGTTRTSMEPRIRMVMSSKVTASIFYKRTVNEPLEGSASKIQGTTTNEYGLDVRITIQ